MGHIDQCGDNHTRMNVRKRCAVVDFPARAT